MHFTIQREALLKPLQLVAGVVERRQTLPVLSNVLLVVEGQQLSLTGTDLEGELVGRVQLEEPADPGSITVPARKLMDICKSLPNDALIDIKVDEQKLVVKAGRSRFTLSTLPANDFPTVEEGPGSLTCSLEQSKLRRLIERTSFAMAQQDVRYYLNGMLLEVSAGIIRAVATDGDGHDRAEPFGHVLDAGRYRSARPPPSHRPAQRYPGIGAPADRAGRQCQHRIGPAPYPRHNG